MFFRRSLALALVTSAATLVGCAVDPTASTSDADEDVPIGDGSGPENEIVAERQLNGRELPSKTVTLTFDDGPGRRTAELADFLASKGIEAAFFINGKQVPGRQAAVDRVVGRGHLLANHTQNHKQLTSLGASSIVREVSETDALIARVQPGGPWVIRAPFGAWNGNVARAINGTAMKKYVGSVFWDEGGELTANSAADWDCWGKGVSVQRCGELYLKEIRAKQRGIVLMHDIHDKTVDMVKDVVVPALIAEGYSFAPLAEVPAVARAIGAASGEPPRPEQCSSATLGRNVDENVCVQSRSTQKWSRCVDGEWIASAGPGDAACTERFPL